MCVGAGRTKVLITAFRGFGVSSSISTNFLNQRRDIAQRIALWCWAEARAGALCALKSVYTHDTSRGLWDTGARAPRGDTRETSLAERKW